MEEVRQMNIIVPVKFVPDLVEELKIDDAGAGLDPDWLRLKVNEFDEHAVEEAILLKERGEGTVTVISLDADCAEDVLYTAAAKGVDRIIKLCGDFGEAVNSHALARLLVPVIQELQPDLILTGVQAHNDLDGPLGPLLAEYLGFPYVGYIAGVSVSDHSAILRKEFPGGLIVEMEVNLPAVLGIQAAEQPPRYVAFSKIRQAAKTTNIIVQSILEVDCSDGPVISRMYLPESSQRAEMLQGDVDTVAAKLVEILAESGAI
jgi:electron transfer flavoprotein beta subunit